MPAPLTLTEDSKLHKWLGLDLHRLNRSSYIYSGLGLIAAYLVIVLIINAGHTFFGDGGTALIVIIAVVLYYIYGINLGIRRLHDLNYSGWYILLMIVPLANIYVFFQLYFFKGTEGPNDYGNELDKSYLFGFPVN